MTSTRLRRRTARAPLLRSAGLLVPAAALLLSACGPSTPLKTGLAPVDLNVRLGNHATPVPPPPPQAPAYAALVAGFPPPFVPPAAAPLPTFAAPPFTPAQVCPSAAPFAFPPLGATQSPAAPPVAGKTYAFRYVGKFTSGSTTYTYPVSGTRTIQHVATTNVSGQNTYSFDVVEQWNGYTTTTSYLVVPNSPSP